MSKWQEYPECPACGAIQDDPGTTETSTWTVACHSCGRKFQLAVQVTRRYRATALEEA